MIKVPHRIFYPDGTYDDTTQEVPDDYFDSQPVDPPLTNEEITEILMAMNGEETVNVYNSIKYQRGGGV